MHCDDDGEFGYVDHRGKLSPHNGSPVERWVNSFADELIMSARYVRIAWARGDSIDSIQERFGVTDAVLGNRLITLGLI